MMSSEDKQATLILEYESEEQLATVLYFLNPIIIDHKEIEIPFFKKTIRNYCTSIGGMQRMKQEP